jgi:hypothetical protein
MSNESILSLIIELGNKIKELESKFPYHPIIQEYIRIFRSDILSWMGNLYKDELTVSDNERLSNAILDLLSKIYLILKEK